MQQVVQDALSAVDLDQVVITSNNADIEVVHVQGVTTVALNGSRSSDILWESKELCSVLSEMTSLVLVLG